jgi:hypothetical protein
VEKTKSKQKQKSKTKQNFSVCPYSVADHKLSMSSLLDCSHHLSKELAKSMQSF